MGNGGRADQLLFFFSMPNSIYIPNQGDPSQRLLFKIANSLASLLSSEEDSSNGLTPSHTVSLSSTNPNVVVASAAKVFFAMVYNSASSVRKLAWHDTASSPTAGVDIYASILVPPVSTAVVPYPKGLAFSEGVAFTTVTGIADNDNAPVTANDMVIDIGYMS